MTQTDFSRNLLYSIAFAVMFSAAAQAEPSMPLDAHPGPPQLFISPAGEPFRASFEEPYPIAAWFDQADRNHDGRLDRAEFARDFERFFAVLDRSHAGWLSGSDVDHYETEVLGGVASGGYYRGAAGGGEGGQGATEDGAPEAPKVRYDLSQVGAARFGLIAIPEPVAAMDRNLDGRVSLEELRDAAESRFDLLDTTQRGYVTLASLPKTPAQSRRRERKDRRDRHPGQKL